MRRFSVRLPVIPPPPHGTRSVLVQSEGLPPFEFLRGTSSGNLLCGNCSFELAHGIGLRNVRDVVFKCPSCGSYCDTPFIPALEQLVQELLSTPNPAARAVELKSKLQLAQQSGKQKEALQLELASDSEALAKLITLLEPKTAGDFYSMLGCIVAFLAFLATLRQRPSPQVVVNQFIGSQDRPSAQSRNSKCFCGSGRKYKHCHGKAGSSPSGA